ncbi:hypothetical protein F2Q68_00013790 [Brassica cretica]|uniref:Uncharacterized protein n=1 Tax=Brassica cretica TaxID=69181 RepID=A0A8S9HQA7_BRACR|nr:hypothetical protein F2Q68_00013790 [Brassica cretica]
MLLVKFLRNVLASKSESITTDGEGASSSLPDEQRIDEGFRRRKIRIRRMHNRQNSAVTAGDSSSSEIGFEEEECLFEKKSLIQERERES